MEQNNMKKAMGVVEESLANFTVSLFKKADVEKKPSRFPLIVIGFAAFMMLTLLDLIAAVAVGAVTNLFYGLLVFSVGVGSFVIAAVGHFFAYAGFWQKFIAWVDGFVSLSSTLVIGLLAALAFAVINLNYFDIDVFYIEISILGLLVGIGVLHVVLWVAYVLVDKGVKMHQDYQNKRAESEMFQKGFDLAKNLIASQLATGAEFQTMVSENKGGLLRENLKSITGQDVEILAGKPYTVKNNGNNPEPVNFQTGQKQ